MWQYRQADGALSRDGEVIAHGYSGHGAGVNNPAAEKLAGEGPIPAGAYTFGEPHTSAKVGLYAMALVPNAGTNTFGRSAFLCHGDNSAGNHTASHGCIILMRPTRQAIWQSGDHALSVVP